MEDAFKVINNKEAIQDFSIPSGGKSGQFFFFTKDNKLLIKTISKPELKVILKNIDNYSEHLNSNPNSLIAKIVALFSLKRLDN